MNNHVLDAYLKNPETNSNLHIESSLAGVEVVTNSWKINSSSTPKTRYFNISTKNIEFVIDTKKNELKFNKKPFFKALDKAYKTVETFMNALNKK